MTPPRENDAAPEIVDALAELLGQPLKEIRVQEAAGPRRPDLVVSTPGRYFVAGYKNVASAGPLAGAIRHLSEQAKAVHRKKSAVPLMVVPFMGPVGERLCEEAGVSWLDLSGNAKIVAPGLRIWVHGRPNKYAARGRPPNVFAPKSSRVSRQLLLRPERFQTQSELARETGLDDGYVSKIVRRLEQEEYLDANETGAVRPRDPALLLDAWRDTYDFGRHRILKGHVFARSGEDLLAKLAGQLARPQENFAATGLAAAWLYHHYAAFRLVTVYLSAMPSRAVLNEIGFKEQPSGANLWLVVPQDEGVFAASQVRDAIRCVSPVQTYLDLKGQPERAKDAAAELRKKFLNWGRHGK
ncbi:MAG TPA: winged helix-turn-helix transcriptional regulator [Pirellulales bacterium]|nr:winged helix-turn-helix transcriptional regulator [Pirellulales bacterium]